MDIEDLMRGDIISTDQSEAEVDTNEIEQHEVDAKEAKQEVDSDEEPKMDAEENERPETDADEIGHPDMEDDEKGPSEMDADEKGPSEIVADEKGPSEKDVEEKGHSEVDAEEKGPSDMDNDEKGHSEMDNDEKGPSEMDNDEKGSSENDNDEKEPSEMDNDEMEPSEIDDETGEPVIDADVPEHNESDADEIGDPEVEAVDADQREVDAASVRETIDAPVTDILSKKSGSSAQEASSIDAEADVVEVADDSNNLDDRGDSNSDSPCKDVIHVSAEEAVAEAIQRDMNRMSHIDATVDEEEEESPASPSVDNNPPQAATEAPKDQDVEQSNSPEKNDGADEPIENEPPKRSLELEKYWKGVHNNPTDFTGWTYLLQYVEQENEIQFAREAFDEFFCLFPYCYGYWKKYADMEKRHENLDQAKEVYERGLKAIPLSVDLWTHYLNFATIHMTGDEYETTIRTLYERAVRASGMDFRSDKLWDQYISWEKEMGNFKMITSIYERLLQIPTQMYSTHFENFKKFISEHHPKDILDLDEFLRLRQEVVETLSSRASDFDAIDIDDPCEDGDEAPPGLEPSSSNKKFDAAEVKDIQDKIVSLREVYFKVNEEEVTKRWTYEEGIRRPYFHVKSLERAQLKNWKDYLNYEIERKSHVRTVVLFERCLIACALYEEFWLKYASYLEPHSVEGVRNVFRRACSIHLRKKPNIHLSWAAFEERNGNTEEAWEILKNIENALPGMAMLGMQRIGLERRQGNHQEAEQLFRDYIESSTSKALKGFYMIKYARYVFKISKNKDKAIGILEKAAENDSHNHQIYLHMINMEFETDHFAETKIVVLFNKVIRNESFPDELRLLFSQRRMEYLEDYGTDVTKIMEMYEQHQQLLRDISNKDGKKRNNEHEVSQPRDSTSAHHKGSSSHKRSADSDDSSSSRKKGKVDGSNGTSAQFDYGPTWNYNSGGSNQQSSQQSGQQFIPGYNQGWGNYHSQYYQSN